MHTELIERAREIIQSTGNVFEVIRGFSFLDWQIDLQGEHLYARADFVTAPVREGFIILHHSIIHPYCGNAGASNPDDSLSSIGIQIETLWGYVETFENNRTHYTFSSDAPLVLPPLVVAEHRVRSRYWLGHYFAPFGFTSHTDPSVNYTEWWLERDRKHSEGSSGGFLF